MSEQIEQLDAQIIAIKRGQKRPTGPWTVTDVRTSREELDALREHNRAIVLGSRWIVIDVEGPSKTVSGMAQLPHLETVLGSLPYTVRWQTPSGGLAYLYRRTDERHCDLSGTLGIELRTGAHYCLLPPSIYKDSLYVWIDAPSDVLESEGEIPCLPESWRDWFSDQSPTSPTSQTEHLTSYYQPQWRSVIDQDLPHADADMSYHDWWKIAAVCHRAGCMDTFEAWSRTGTKYNDDAQKFINDADNIFARRQDISKQIGISSFLRLVKPAGNVLKLVRTEREVQSVSRPQLQLELDGISRLIHDDVVRSMPEPYEYRYLAPMVVLSTLSQRRIRVPNSSSMNYHLLAGGAGSRKSTLQQALRELISSVSDMMVINKPASVQALQRCFAESPSRFLAIDEGIDRLISLYSPKAINTPLQETFAGMLEYFGSPQVVAGQENKRKDESQKAALSPRLTFLICGVTEQLLELCGIDKFFSSGMASRLAPWVVDSPADDFSGWWSNSARGIAWSDDTVKALKKLRGINLASSETHPKLVDYTISAECREIFAPYWNEMNAARQHNSEYESIYMRMQERAIWYGGLHAYGCGRTEIQAPDIQLGITLCRYHRDTWQHILHDRMLDDVSQCSDAILRALERNDNIASRSRISQSISSKFRGSVNYRLREMALASLIDDLKIIKIGKLYKRN